MSAPDTWRQEIERICDAALQLVGEQRERFLATACGSNQQLRREVDALLAHDRSADAFLRSPIGAVAAAVMHAPKASLIGTRIGAYEILSLLGGTVECKAMGRRILPAPQRTRRLNVIKGHWCPAKPCLSHALEGEAG